MISIYLFFFLIFFSKASDYTAQGVCGNGIREIGEECDDGNSNNKDGCSKNCTVEINYLCAKNPKTLKDLCFLDFPLIAELNYIQHSNPPCVELRFNRPIVYSNLYILRKSIALQVGQDNKNGESFMWNLTVNQTENNLNQSFLIKMFFQKSYYMKSFKLTFLDPYSFIDIFGKSLSLSSSVLTINLPMYLVYSEISRQFIDFMNIFILIVMIIMLILCLPFSIFSSIGLFWNLFDFCQLLHIILLINCDYPDPIIEFFKGFAVTNFRLINYFNENIVNNNYYNENFKELWLLDREYSTMFLANAFYCSIFIGFFCFIITILVLLSSFNRNLIVCLARVKNLLCSSIFIRATLVTYTPFCLATMLQFLNFDFSKGMNILNSLLALGVLIYLLIIPFVYIKLLNNKKLLQNEEEYITKIKPLIELLNLKAILKRNFQIFYTMRKFLWITFIVLLWDDVLRQIFWVILVQISIITLHILKRPYIDRKINYMLLITEILLLLALFLITILISFDYLRTKMDLEVRIGVSWCIAGILSSIVFIKLCFVFIELAENLRYLIPKAKKMFKKFNEVDNLIEIGAYSTDKNNISDSSFRNLNTLETSNKNQIVLNKN